MDIICSPLGIVDRERPGQGVMDLTGAGFENGLLDLSLFVSEHELEDAGKRDAGGTGPGKRGIGLYSAGTRRLLEYPETLREALKPVLDKCIREGLRLPMARAPHLRRDTKREDLGESLARLTEESLKVCGEAGCTSLIVRPLSAGVESGKEWEVNRSFYLKLAQTAQERQVTILLENQCRDVGGHLVRGICADGREAAQWVDALNGETGEERFGFCMDVGVCSLCGQNMQEFARLLGSRLKAVILRDCDGHRENAMLPFTCADGGRSQTDWLSLIRGLREIGFDGKLILDMGDTAASFSPLLRPQLMRLAKAVADYFRWQIEMEALIKRYSSIVLFGAGNMCRNYMKCYGEKYPPLFTCDNNPSLWGSEFCGLKVKSPESLKEIPMDCAILICNIYYREIERQLREMGVENTIAFFNDEYMPSFYFDRVERVETHRQDLT